MRLVVGDKDEKDEAGNWIFRVVGDIEGEGDIALVETGNVAPARVLEEGTVTFTAGGDCC